jgi:glycosyltransferase involved in cell wall biosynthesis
MPGQRVGYLVNQYPEPSHTFIRREIAALERRGFDVRRYALRRPTAVVGEQGRVEQAKTRVVLDVGPVRLLLSVIVRAMSSPRRFARALGMATRLGWRGERGVLVNYTYLAEACVIRGWAEHDGVDHLHAHFGTNPTAVALLCHVLGGPSYSFTAHGPKEFDGPVALRLDLKIRHARFAVAISRYGLGQLYRWARHTDWPKLALVRCGLDFSELSPQPPATARPMRLLCVARLHEQKGHFVLLDAAALLRDRGVEFTLRLVGDGELREDIEAGITQRGLADRVEIVGWLDDAGVAEELRAATALVVPSFAEGLPIVLMEAMATGRPVVATRIAGIPELVDDSTGCLVTAGSAVELAAALTDMSTADSDTLARLGAHGAERVRRQHDIERTADAMASLLDATSADAVAAAVAELS